MTIATTKQPTIRAATRADLGGIEALLLGSELPTEGIHDDLCGFLIAEVDSKIVGVVGMERHGRFGLLRSTAVDPHWRNHGVARRLIDRIIADAESQGVNALYLLTTTAERYFPSFGFATVKRDSVPPDIRETGEFRETCPDSATVMCLSLSGGAVER